MPPISHLLKPKYIIVAILSLVGFVMMYGATGADIDLIIGDPIGWFADLDGTAQVLFFLAGLAIFIGSAVYLFRDQKATPGDDVSIGEPPFAHFLFHNTASAPLWLGIRLYLGFEWLSAGWHKLDNEAWRNGDALKGYWTGAVYVPTAEEAQNGMRPRISYDGWREFINYMLDNEWYKWFNWVIILGEILVGLGLILGALTGVAAFFGATMNVSFLLSGSTSSNPPLLLLAILIVVAWRVAGYIGLDRWLIPALGTPWYRGSMMDSRERIRQVARQAEG